jgi:hypothetical protein
MALVSDPDELNQGKSNVTSATSGDLVWAIPDATLPQRVVITSATGAVPLQGNQEFFEVRGHATESRNDGLYLANTTWRGPANVAAVYADKIDVDVTDTGTLPQAAGAASVANIFGETTSNTTLKNVMIDLAQNRLYLLEQGFMDGTGTSNGAIMQAVYSFLKEEWKTDPELIKDPFPIIAITPEQFEFQYGWEPRDVTANGVVNSFAGRPETVRTRKMVRTGGWSEIDATANTNLTNQYVGVITLGTFEDNANDTAYYEEGSDPTRSDTTIDFTFNGPVNEAIRTYNNVGNVDTLTFVDGGGGNDTITRATGSFVTDGFIIGGDVTVVDAASNNNGTFELLDVSATTLTVATASFGTAGADAFAKLAVDNRRAIKLFLRIRDGDPNGKTYDSSDLTSIGAADGVDNKVFRFPLSNATDLDISATDTAISTSAGTGADPYSEIRLRYLTTTYNREVDTTTKRDYGIVVDCGTFSQSEGRSHANSYFSFEDSTFPTGPLGLGSGEALADYNGGTLIIHEGTDQGSYSVTGTPTDEGTNGKLVIQLGSSLTATETNLSFTLQRATPISANAAVIYEKIQYQLRQASDVDETSSVVNGKTADGLAQFVGPDLRMGSLIPSNPNGAGSGVIIEGFDSNDTNNLFFFDNTGTSRNFPFVAAGTISFNNNLVNDTSGFFWMFFTYSERYTEGVTITGGGDTIATFTRDGSGDAADFSAELAAGDYIRLTGFDTATNDGIYVVTGGLATTTFDARRIDGTTITNEGPNTVTIDRNPIDSPDATLVNDNGGSPITGSISSSSIAFDFDYDGNVQAARTAATDAPITLRAIGFDAAQFVEATGTITRATGLSFSLVAGLERNYENA